MKNNTHILTIGGAGMVGSRVTQLLTDSYQFEDAGRSSGLNITSSQQVSERLRGSQASVVILYAAKADVEGCEKDKPFGTQGDAWKVNVTGVHNVAKACEKTGKKLIYISTDFIFGGAEPRDGGFTEDDLPSPVNWYGRTKYEGEKAVAEIKTPWIIIRPAYPYRAEFEGKKDFVRVFLTLLQQGKKLSLITDHINNPTFIDDFAGAIDVLIKQNATGIYHVTGSEALSPFQEGIKVAETFGLDKNLIGQTTRAEFFKDRAPRPFSLAMNNAKIRSLGVTMKTFSEGLREIKRQLS